MSCVLGLSSAVDSDAIYQLEACTVHGRKSQHRIKEESHREGGNPSDLGEFAILAHAVTLLPGMNGIFVCVFMKRIAGVLWVVPVERFSTQLGTRRDVVHTPRMAQPHFHKYPKMIDDNDEEDEEQNIELRRGGGRSASPQHSGNNRYTSSAGSSSFSPPRRSSSPTAAARTNGSRRSVAEGQQDQQHHAIHLGQHDVRPPSYSNPTAPLLEKFTSVLSATSQVVNLDTVADSVAEAMSLLQHPFGGGSTGRRKNLETYSLEPKLQEAKETHTRLKLQAFWQLLLTGFEVSFSRTVTGKGISLTRGLLALRFSSLLSASAHGSGSFGSGSTGDCT